MLKGIGVSAGVAQGTAYLMTCGYRSAVPQRSIGAAEVDGERRRLDSAVARAEAELLVLQEDVREKIGATQADIFGAQRLILGDAFWRDRVLRAVEEKRINVEAAVSDVFEDYTRDLESVPDGFLQSRAADIDDVRRRGIFPPAIGAGHARPRIPGRRIVGPR